MQFIDKLNKTMIDELKHKLSAITWASRHCVQNPQTLNDYVWIG